MRVLVLVLACLSIAAAPVDLTGRVRLENGVEALVVPREGGPLVALLVSVEAGSRHETAATAGAVEPGPLPGRPRARRALVAMAERTSGRIAAAPGPVLAVPTPAEPTGEPSRVADPRERAALHVAVRLGAVTPAEVEAIQRRAFSRPLAAVIVG